MSKPLIILPCSQEKLSESAAALKLYQGKGYIPLLDKSTASIGMDYDLAFLSAKYGLVHAYEEIEPYEQKLSPETLPVLVDSKKRAGNSLIKSLSPSSIIACLPKLYLRALLEMLNEDHQQIPLACPEAGSGIGSQRGFLASQLRAIEPAFTDVFFFGHKTKGKPSPTMLVRIAPGVTFRPWLRNEGPDMKPEYGKPVTAAKFINSRSGNSIVDDKGQIWSTTSFKFGLCDEQKHAIMTYIDENAGAYDDEYKTVNFCEIMSNTLAVG